jgi:hypothetical protein
VLSWKLSIIAIDRAFFSIDTLEEGASPKRCSDPSKSGGVPGNNHPLKRFSVSPIAGGAEDRRRFMRNASRTLDQAKYREDNALAHGSAMCKR